MKICHFSDTRGLHSLVTVRDMIRADLVIFSGNSTPEGNKEEFDEFINWFIDIPVKYKVLIAGNRDYCLQINNLLAPIVAKFTSLKGNFYLKNSSCEIEGKKIYGTPYSLYFPYSKESNIIGENNFILYNQYAAEENYKQIPDDTNILVTSVPPFEILDITNGEHIGIKYLRDRVEDLSNLQLHCFGRAFNNGICDTFNTKFSNGNLSSKQGIIEYRPNIFEID
jgi:Icc-related predicted phosphoesterase